MGDSNVSSASGVTYSILAGISAASASVFGKLAVDPTVVHKIVHYTNLEPSILDKAVFGYVLFGEPLEMSWWFGALFILLGLYLIAIKGSEDVPEKPKDSKKTQ